MRPSLQPESTLRWGGNLVVIVMIGKHTLVTQASLSIVCFLRSKEHRELARSSSQTPSRPILVGASYALQSRWPLSTSRSHPDRP